MKFSMMNFQFVEISPKSNVPMQSTFSQSTSPSRLISDSA